MRHNASPFSGSIGTYGGTQKYLLYDPSGSFSKRHIIGIFVMLFDLLSSVVGLLKRQRATRYYKGMVENREKMQEHPSDLYFWC